MPSRPEQEPVLRWGVLGAAGIATRTVIPAIQTCALGRVQAIASRSAARAEAAAAALGIPRWYGSYEELLADADIDAVYNPLPNHLHVPWSVRAAAAGKHVLCEKPIAVTAREALDLLEARDSYGVQVAEAFMVRSHPRWHAVREVIRAGRIGELRLVTGHFSYFRRDPSDVRSHPEWGGGALLDIGCYPVTMSRWLFGAEPVEVMASIEFDAEFGVDWLTSGILRFAEGHASFTCAGQVSLHQRMQVMGTRGRIDVDIPFNPPSDRPTRLVVDDGRGLAGEGAEVVEFPAVNQYALQMDAFARAVRGEGEVPVTLEDAVANMRVLDALFRSARTRSWEQP